MSSAVPAPRAAALGLRPLACLGDYVRVPTTGLAVSQTLLDADSQLVSSTCEALRRGLTGIRERPGNVTEIIARSFSQSDDEAQWTYTAIVERLCSEGRVDTDDAQEAVDLISRKLGIETRPSAEQIYTASALTAEIALGASSRAIHHRQEEPLRSRPTLDQRAGTWHTADP